LTDKATIETTSSPGEELKETGTSATPETKPNLAKTKNVNSTSVNTTNKRVQPPTNEPSSEESSRCKPHTSPINGCTPGPSSKTRAKEVSVQYFCNAA